MEARESQREIMRLTALEASHSGSESTPTDAPRPYLDLAQHRVFETRSTVTSLESLASIDIRDEQTDRNLKRNRDLIRTIDKESQVKEQRISFKGLFTSCDTSKGSPKKFRKED